MNTANCIPAFLAAASSVLRSAAVITTSTRSERLKRAGLGLGPGLTIFGIPSEFDTY